MRLPQTRILQLLLGLAGAISTTARATIRSGCTESPGNCSTNPTGPLLTLSGRNGDLADPRGLFNNTYYAYSSTNYAGQGTNVPHASSPTFNDGWSWSNKPDMLPAPGAWTTYDPNNSSINPEVDNPFVAYVGGQFVMYYSADYPLSHNQTLRCIGTATASEPLPPSGFTAQPDVLVCSDPPTMGEYYISAQLIVHQSQNYLVFKYMGGNNGTNPNLHANIQLVKLSEDGLSITSPRPYQTLYESTPSDWDAEGPSIRCPDDGDTCYLLYVIRNYATAAYAIHYVTSTTGIAGPYGTEGIDFLSTGESPNGQDAWLLSPGGPSFFSDTEMLFMTTKPTLDCEYGQPLVRGPRAAIVTYGEGKMQIANTTFDCCV